MTLAERFTLSPKMTFIQSDEIWANPCLSDGLEIKVKIKSVSPLSPNLTQAGWDPPLTSWPEDSAVGPPHCHSYGVVSCAKQKWKEQRAL